MEEKNPVTDITDRQILQFEAKGYDFPTKYPISNGQRQMMKEVRKKLLRSKTATRYNRRKRGDPEESQEELLRRKCAVYQQHNLKLNALLQILVLQSMAKTAKADGVGSRMRTNFVFNEMTPEAVVINAEMVNVEQDIYPCGMQRTGKILEKIAHHHETLCDTTLPETDILDDPTKVKRHNAEYIMLPGLMSYEEGRRACESLGSHLADIRSDEQRKQFVKLMNSESRTKAYAGIEISNKEASPIFMSDGLWDSSDPYALGFGTT